MDIRPIYLKAYQNQKAVKKRREANEDKTRPKPEQILKVKKTKKKVDYQPCLDDPPFN